MVGIDVRQIDEVRMEAVFLADGPDRPLQRPEPLAERHLLLVGQPLLREHEHGVFLERLENPGERRVVDRMDLDALDAGAEMRVERGDLHGRWPSTSCVVGGRERVVG